MFVRFCKFQNLFEKRLKCLKTSKRMEQMTLMKVSLLLVLPYCLLYNCFKSEAFVVEFYIKLKLIFRIITYLAYICLGS